MSPTLIFSQLFNISRKCCILTQQVETPSEQFQSPRHCLKYHPVPIGSTGSCRNGQQSMKSPLLLLSFLSFTSLSSGVPKTSQKKLHLLFTYFIALQLEELKLHRNPVLGWRDHLPHAVFVRRVLPGPAWAGDGAIELAEKSATSRCRKKMARSPHKVSPSQPLATHNKTPWHLKSRKLWAVQIFSSLNPNGKVLFLCAWSQPNYGCSLQVGKQYKQNCQFSDLLNGHNTDTVGCCENK